MVTQVDDCPTGNNLQSASVVLNGETIEVACEPEPQTFTILGANGAIGDIDPYTMVSSDGGQTWGPAFLSGSHPWNYITGTDSWVSWNSNQWAGVGTTTNPTEYDFRIRFYVPEDVTNPSMVFRVNPDNRADIWLNSTFLTTVTGSPNFGNNYNYTAGPAIVEGALHSGMNEIRLRLIDWGGIVALNYRIDVTMTSCEDLADAVEESDWVNSPPLADAGDDQSFENVVSTASVALDGSRSSDIDNQALSYTWSENGSVIATGVNPTISLGDGSHTINLTVSDGELSATDQVVVTVVTNVAPVAQAGGDQSFGCVVETVDVNLDGSGSSDADGDALTYSWLLDGAELSSAASFTATLGGGNHTLTLTVSDGAKSASDQVQVNVVLDVTDPEIIAPESFTVSNDEGLCGAEVDFSVTATDDCDLASLVVTPESGSFFEVGTTVVTATAMDAAGNTSNTSFEVTVEDNEAPVFVALANPLVMWPPNHKYKTFDVSDFVVSVSDNCSPLGTADVTISFVTSDEPEDVRGGGDGKTSNDMVIGSGSIDLRAERQGGGNGRVYTIHLTVADENGNSSSASCQVTVPHNKNGTAIDDGSVYTVNGAALGKFAGNNEETADIGFIPDVFQLEQNFPNPFNPSTTISYGLPESGLVSLVIYDMRGSMVSQLVNTYQSAGSHTVHFNAADIPAGTYLYMLEANGEQHVKRMLLLK